MLSRAANLASAVGFARARLLLALSVLLIGLMFPVAIGWFVITLRHSAIDDATREMRNDALMLAEQDDRLLQAVDIVQVAVAEHIQELDIDAPVDFERLMAREEMHRYLKDQITGHPFIAAISLIDRRGAVINVSRSWPPPPFDENHEVVVHGLAQEGGGPTSINGPVQSKTTGLWALFFTRKLLATDGQLIGYISSTIELSYFESFYARLPLTGDGAYGLFLRNGTLVAHYPRVDPKIGRSYLGTKNFQLFVDALDDGVVPVVSRIDGKHRLAVPHTIAHFPLFVVVSDTVDSILAPWRRETRALVITTGLLEAVLLATALIATRHLRGYEHLQIAETGRHRAEVELALAREREGAAEALQAHERRFDTALQNMLQGLMMVSHSGIVLVVNWRFHELFGLPANCIVAGMSYREMTGRVVEYGNVCADDMAGVRERRAALIAGGEQATSTWELSDGRIFNVTHQPIDEGWLTTFEDVTELRATEARITYLAHHDALTNLPNRALFRDKLSESLTFARRGDIVALHCLDLDQFKAVNDTLGHPIGDALLQAVAERLRPHIRDSDTIARLGGDEFAIVQAPIQRPTEATSLAGRLNALIEAPFDIGGHQIVIGTSIGIAFAPQDAMDADELLRNADLALYRAKLDGRGVYRLFQSEMDAQMQIRRLLELDLRQALPGNQFEVFYQPFVNLHEGTVSGVEALLRWRHPHRGLVPPAQFIPLAEELGVIVPIGEWVLREACTTVASWPGNMRVAVNLSPAQFRSLDLLPAIHAAVQQSGLPADRLELEITETVMLQDTEATLATLSALRNLGVRIAMDDFGTGYSSLGYLRRFPFDRIKIDQSFVRDLCTKPDCRAIVRAVAGLSQELGMATTAEGVETQEQLDALSSAGCTEVQGYLFSPAVPADEVSALLARISQMLQSTPKRMLQAAAG